MIASGQRGEPLCCEKTCGALRQTRRIKHALEPLGLGFDPSSPLHCEFSLVEPRRGHIRRNNITDAMLPGGSDDVLPAQG